MGQTAGCFQSAVVGNGYADDLVKVRKAIDGAHLVRPHYAADLPSMLSTSVGPQSLRTTLSSSPT